MEGTTPEAALGRQQHGPQRRRDRLDTAQSASALGLARGAVLQAFAPQAGGAYEDGDSFEADCEAEREMEAEQKSGQPRRRRRVVAESEDEDGATDEGSGEGAPRRRQRVAEESEDAESNADESEEDESNADESEDAESNADESEEDESNADESEDDESNADEAEGGEEQEDAAPSDGGEEQADDEGGADQGAQQAAQQTRQTKAQEASERDAKFHQEQRGRVHAPAIADSGMLPWGGVSVEVAQLVDESKVRCKPLPRAPQRPALPFCWINSTPSPAAGARLWHDAQD